MQRGTQYHAGRRARVLWRLLLVAAALACALRGVRSVPATDASSVPAASVAATDMLKAVAGLELLLQSDVGVNMTSGVWQVRRSDRGRCAALLC